MIIPTTIRQQWDTLKIRGDIKKMSEGDATIRRYISVAMAGGECTEETFIRIRDFYNKRIELLNTALPNGSINNIQKNARASAVG